MYFETQPSNYQANLHSHLLFSCQQFLTNLMYYETQSLYLNVWEICDSHFDLKIVYFKYFF